MLVSAVMMQLLIATFNNNTTGTTIPHLVLALWRKTPSNNAAVGYQLQGYYEHYASNVFIGQLAGYSDNAGSFNTYIGRVVLALIQQQGLNNTSCWVWGWCRHNHRF
jgi:hypothetical protein